MRRDDTGLADEVPVYLRLVADALFAGLLQLGYSETTLEDCGVMAKRLDERGLLRGETNGRG